MSEDDWDSGWSKSVAVFLNGDAIPSPDLRGEKVVDDNFFLMFNAHHEPIDFVMPPESYGASWEVEVDTAAPVVALDNPIVKAGQQVTADGRSIVVLRCVY